MSAEKLYTPQVLALAVELAGWPPDKTMALHGEARSATCGSTLAMDMSLDDNGRISGLGLQVRACAIGQAAAAIFARHANGRCAQDIAATHSALEAWLAGAEPRPDWPDLPLIEAARAYPARHGAMKLPWTAALNALSSAPIER